MLALRNLAVRGFALGVFLGLPVLPADAAPPVAELKPQIWVHTHAGSWKLVSSIFSRQTNKVLKIPSWTGSYEYSEPRTSSEPAAPARPGGHTLTSTIYYFPTPDRTKDVMISPTGSGFKADLKAQLSGVDEAYGVQLHVNPGQSVEVTGGAASGKHLVEVRCRRGRIVSTFVGRPVGVDLLSFAREFLKTNGILGEWKETAILIRASQGEKELFVKGSVATDETYSGAIKLSPTENLSLEFTLRRVVCRADQLGIQRSEGTPVEEARVWIKVGGDVYKGVSDDKGVLKIDVGKVSQRKALSFGVAIPGLDRDARGQLKLRYGHPKEKLIDAGRYEPTSAPTADSPEEIGQKELEFLKAIFSDDVGRFPRSLDQDRFSSLEYTPLPQLLHVVAWKLAKQAKDKEQSQAFSECLPLDALTSVAPATQPLEDGSTATLFESVEALLALSLETGESGWNRVALHKLKETLPPPSKAWSERFARRCLALWRLAEIAHDQPLEAQARRETDALVRAIRAAVDPTETIVTKRRTFDVPMSGAPGGHGWAALALFKGFELVGEPSYKATALLQISHLLDKHVERGVIGYSHSQKGERPGAIHSTLNVEGAYPEVAVTTHALLLAFHHTHERSYADQAMAIRARVLGFWRKEYGGFGKLDYWEGAGAGEGKDPKSQLRPLALKKQASIYQQPWALVTFLPTMYPYWGEATREERPSKGILDFLFRRRD
jgi:hypothetical protein